MVTSGQRGFMLLNKLFKGKLAQFAVENGNQCFLRSLNLAIEVIGRDKDNKPVLLLAHYVIEENKLIPCPVVEVGVNTETNSIKGTL